MTTPEAVLVRAEALIDEVHRSDPEHDELAYSRSLLAWVERLVSDPSEALRLAARAQHLERWAIPRDSYPLDRPGYLRWRIAVHDRQGQRAAEICREAGCPDELCARIDKLVAKRTQKEDPEGQALEDAACLVFLDEQAPTFAERYDDDKMIGIIQKTWRKMSPAGHQLALGLPLSGRLKDLVTRALSGS
jgi:hypothetical protein